MPAAWSCSGLIWPPWQQAAMVPSTTTVGTRVTPYSWALSAPASRTLWTITSQSGQPKLPDQLHFRFAEGAAGGEHLDASFGHVDISLLVGTVRS